eukprot:TRINITY_DN69005_c0_g1_i1.p1 TRINITY_DN69005_c0_g1~~TRINITY_DN69005_c0_g1_i1.p1  ORF type:complete len:343 (+),score=43.29 TRINITY_DN69005_c0_g1_i1:113-1141(+)
MPPPPCVRVILEPDVAVLPRGSKIPEMETTVRSLGREAGLREEAAFVLSRGFRFDPVMAWVFPSLDMRLQHNISFFSTAFRHLSLEIHALELRASSTSDAASGCEDQLGIPRTVFDAAASFGMAAVAVWVLPPHKGPGLSSMVAMGSAAIRMGGMQVAKRIHKLMSMLETGEHGIFGTDSGPGASPPPPAGTTHAFRGRPHIHLLMLSADLPYQGKGLGGAVLAPGLAHADQAGACCYLESSNPRNVPFYERHGFVTVAVRRMGLDTWSAVSPVQDASLVEFPPITFMVREPRGAATRAVPRSPSTLSAPAAESASAPAGEDAGASDDSKAPVPPTDADATA